jgi:hypothetical protein
VLKIQCSIIVEHWICIPSLYLWFTTIYLFLPALTHPLVSSSMLLSCPIWIRTQPKPNDKSTEASMRALKHIPVCLLVCALAVFCPPDGLAQQNSDAAKTASQPAERDGQHDFDFELGTWNIHLKRRLHPLTGSNTWVEFDGTSVTRKVWDGRSQLEEFETDSPAGGHIEGLTLRLYNPQTHQWSLYWANSKGGPIFPPQVGEFKNGRGEFYGQDTLNGKLIFIRFVWSNTNTNTPHFEQSFSDDGGKTWEVNWITDQTRISENAFKSTAPQGSDAAKTESQPALRNGQHDFDFYFGIWKQHLKRLLNPLTGSTTWAEFDGTIVVRKVWDGRANLNEFEGEGPTGHIEGLTLRLYNPKTHQWSLYWANSKAGVLSLPPAIGEFKNGRGEFFCQDTLNDRAILIRYVWSDITPNSAHFEQSYSDDGGKTWEVNWISTMTRTQDAADKSR